MVKIDQYLAILEKIKKYSLEEFVSDPEHYGSAERFLHLSIEALNDIGNHIIADLNLGVVNWHSDIPAILAGKGYIDQLLEEKWVRMIGFRNALVHDYLDIDRNIVYEVLQNNLDDFRAIQKVFAQFL